MADVSNNGSEEIPSEFPSSGKSIRTEFPDSAHPSISLWNLPPYFGDLNRILYPIKLCTFSGVSLTGNEISILLLCLLFIKIVIFKSIFFKLFKKV